MNLAINYSPEAEQLYKSGKIKIDYFKTPEWDWLVMKARVTRPVVVHFTLNAGGGNLVQVNWEIIERLMKFTGTPHVNLHLEANTHDFPAINLTSTSFSVMKQVYDRVLSDVLVVTQRFGAKHVIIENLYMFQGTSGNTLRACVEPDLISRIVIETGCGLLLDIAHACIAAEQIGMSPEEYFSRLPVHKLKELHFSGIHRRKGHPTDHRSILKHDWARLDWILARIRSGEWSLPWLLTFEYGGLGAIYKGRCNPGVISSQIPTLYAMVNGLPLYK